MFFMMGINQGRKDLNFHQMVICKGCGAYGRYTVFMTYMVLSLFLIPCFKWSKHYYVQTSCCGTVYELDKEVGRQIERGQTVTIRDEDLQIVNRGHRQKRCARCGFTTEENFDFCPKCGNRL